MAAKPPKAPRRRRAGWLAAGAALTLAAAAADAWMQLHAPLRLQQPATVELALGQRLGSLLGQMERRGLFDNPRQRLYLVAYARLRNASPSLKAGEYEVPAGTTPLGLLRLLASGKVILHELTLVEGWRFAQAWRLIQAEPNLSHTLSGADTAAVMRALDLAGEVPEGRLFPDTYRFPKGTTDAAFLRRAAQAMDRLLAAEWAARAPGLPYSAPAEALVMASLVEKETAQPAERAQIAGVFVRRLRLGMRLQTDPSVIYGLGEAYDGNLRSQDLATDTPYNSYTRGGLPPTPICLPGRESLHAALHPDDSDSLYFVSRGDGTHQFSATLDQHNAAVERYQIKPHLRP
ncbi:MAG: endolytic transglycosylase MltG [Nevskia sp.]|nr:endolytic transglycosylase MltG [Nevskia sp.]